MKKLIKKYDDKILTTRGDIFFSLCKSIIGQQISVAAADSVFYKFKKVCRGKIKPHIIPPKIGVPIVMAFNSIMCLVSELLTASASPLKPLASVSASASNLAFSSALALALACNLAAF